jgi:uncharacterized RDD family membrane protein YckC
MAHKKKAKHAAFEAANSTENKHMRTTNQSVAFASPMQRFIALLIDAILFIIILENINTDWLINKLKISLLVFMILSFICLFILWFGRDIKGRSIGKRIMKIRIVNKADLKSPSLLKCFLRNLTTYLGPYDFWIYWGNNWKESWGDQVTKTIVIKK